MVGEYVIITIVNVFVLLLGVSIGRSIILLKIRREENRKRELELEILERRSDIIERGKEVATNLEDLIYRTHVQQEIDKIIRKKSSQ